MKKLERAAPILAPLDMDQTIAFYTERLGFEATYHDKNYGIVRRDAVVIHFWKTDDPIHPENTGCYLYVSGVDKLYEEMSATGVVHPNGQLGDHPWGMREFSILDVHGNLLRIGQPLNRLDP